MENSLICRACLVTDVKMFNMQTFSVVTAYLDLTGISDVGIYKHICYECVSRLRKCEEFRSNCFKAHETLIQMITIEDMQMQRKIKHLESPLKLTNTNIYEYNENETSYYSEIKTETNNEQSNPKDLVKYEFNENNKQEYDAEDSMLCEFEPENAFPFPKIEEKLDSVLPKKKKRKVIKRKASKLSRDSIDDEPLSKLCRTKLIKRRTVKTKTQNKASKLDAQHFEEYATVTQMTSEDAKREVELRKESRNYRNCPFKCNLCYRGYGAQNAYNNHMKKHALANGTHECEFCYLRFPKRHRYTSHILVCHKQKFSCNLCPYICFSRKQASLHMQLHKGVKYTCDLCQETFSMPNTLLSHKRIKHPTEIVCDLCGSTFTSDKGLSSHHRLIHKQDKNEQKGPHCVECDVHFATETAWKRHLVLSAKHTVSNGCETCGDTFPDTLTLKRHARTHGVYHTRVESAPIPRLPTTCSICDKWLTSRDEYKTHMTSQHPDSDVTKRIHADDNKPCVCEFCGKGFKKRCFMIYHQRKHTGERPYTCDVCKKTFAFPGTLSVHKNIHNTKRMFKCDLCEKVFKSKLSLSKHVKRTHLNIRPHSCDVCGKAFQNPCEVKYHKQHVHGNVPWPKRDRSKRNRNNEEQADLIIDYN